ncbi:MAG: DUF58 domain-containing protein [Verrucomicrobiota bacterium]
MNTIQVRAILSKVRQIEIRTNRLVTETLAGEYHSVFKGRGMNFDEVREYVPGDDVRTIDWNVTARATHGQAFVKKFTEERELTILLAVDVSASGNFGSQNQSKREMAAELASVLAFSAIKNQDKVGLILFTDKIEKYIPPKKGRSHVLRVIREILFFEPERKGTHIPLALNFLNRVMQKRAIVFLISDFYLHASQLPEEFRASLKLTSKRHDLVALHIADPNEYELPKVGVITLQDSETGEVFEVNTSNEKLRHQYAQLAKQKREELHRTLRGAGVDVLKLNTATPYLPELVKFFHKRIKR